MELRPSPLTSIVPIRRQCEGFCAEGPGFYVWDEDPRAVRETVRVLGGRPPSPAAPPSPPSDPERGPA